jgi:succinate dehydrogenase / fumarate reductase flavoprotein subunit
MGGLWVDYNLMSTIPGLFVAGEANFSDHGANRLGASALMQGLADGYFVLPYTVGDYIANNKLGEAKLTDDAFKFAETNIQQEISKLINIKGSRTVDSLHKELGRIMWDKCGMARNKKGLEEAISKIGELRTAFWNDVKVPGAANELNTELEKAGRVADFIELGELMCRDALTREESCGGHYRDEYQVDGEAKRDDEKFCHVAAWEWNGSPDKPQTRHKEELQFDNVHLATRSYK